MRRQNTSRFFELLPANATFVVAFERQPGGDDLLELGELTERGEWRSLDSFEIDFDWRTIDNPPEFQEPRYPKSFGVKFAAWLSDDERSIELVHYDGFAVRAFRLEHAREDWLLHSTEQVIHDTRADLVLSE